MSLPSGYKRLEYIQSSGTQYIDTGFVPDANTRVTADFQLILPGSGNRCVFGTAGQFSFRWYGASSKWRTVGKSAVDFAAGISGTDRYTVDKTATLTKLSTGQTATTVAADSITLTLYLFAQHATTTAGVNSQASMTLWACSIYSGDAIVRDFIPCKNASGVIGLWDDVNSKFYTNAGTGVFTAGPEVAGTHKARIDATDYEIKGGTCTIGATAYKIKKGRVRIDATGYDVAFPETGSTWIFHEDFDGEWRDADMGLPSLTFDFSSNGKQFTGLAVGVGGSDRAYLSYLTQNGSTIVYNKNSSSLSPTYWENEAYRTIAVLSDISDNVLQFLQYFCEKQ